MFNKFMRYWRTIKYIYTKKDGHNIKDKKQGIRTREKLALLYAFVAWNLFGVGFYIILKEKLPTDREGRRASLFNLTGAPGNIHVYQVQGFGLKDKFVMKSEEIDNNLKEGAAR